MRGIFIIECVAFFHSITQKLVHSKQYVNGRWCGGGGMFSVRTTFAHPHRCGKGLRVETLRFTERNGNAQNQLFILI